MTTQRQDSGDLGLLQKLWSLDVYEMSVTSISFSFCYRSIFNSRWLMWACLIRLSIVQRPIPIEEPLVLLACNNVNPCSRYQLHYSGLGSQRVEHMKGLSHGSGPATFHEVARFPSFRSLPLSLARVVYFIAYWSARSNNVESTVT